MNKQDQTFFNKYSISVENLPGEEWKKIEGLEFYEVSNLGRIKRLFRESEEYITVKGLKATRIYFYEEKLLNPTKNKEGYLRVNLTAVNGDKVNYFVHRLVGLAFCVNDDPETKTQINHKNEIRNDNRAINLEWVTPSENANYKNRNQNVSKKLKGKKYGHWSKERRANISAGVIASGAGCKPVITDDNYFKSVKVAAEYYGVKLRSMRNWLNGRTKMPKAYQDLNLRYAAESEVN